MPNLEEIGQNKEVKTEKTLEVLLPSAFSSELLDSARLIQEQFVNKNRSAGLLLAEMFRFKIVFENIDPGKKEIEQNLAVDVLNKLGISAYDFWKNQGMDPEKCSEEAKKWVKSLSEKISKLDYGIRVALPGDNKDDAWMTFRLDKGNYPVEDVVSWAVLLIVGERKIALQKAKVS